MDAGQPVHETSFQSTIPWHVDDVATGRIELISEYEAELQISDLVARRLADLESTRVRSISGRQLTAWLQAKIESGRVEPVCGRDTLARIRVKIAAAETGQDLRR